MKNTMFNIKSIIIAIFMIFAVSFTFAQDEQNDNQSYDGQSYDNQSNDNDNQDYDNQSYMDEQYPDLPSDNGQQYDDQSDASMQDFQDNLSDDGQWTQVDQSQIDPDGVTDGTNSGFDDQININIVWIPNIQDPDWNPYSNGYWQFTDVGWTWVSNYSWGYYPYHYGRWWYSNEWGWVWSPGYTYAPAWVVWNDCGGYEGWYPMSPRLRYDHDRDRYDWTHQNFNEHHWRIVPTGGYVGNTGNTNTQNINEKHGVLSTPFLKNNTFISGGPTVTNVQKYTTTPIVQKKSVTLSTVDKNYVPNTSIVKTNNNTTAKVNTGINNSGISKTATTSGVNTRVNNNTTINKVNTQYTGVKTSNNTGVVKTPATTNVNHNTTVTTPKINTTTTPKVSVTTPKVSTYNNTNTGVKQNVQSTPKVNTNPVKKSTYTTPVQKTYTTPVQKTYTAPVQKSTYTAPVQKSTYTAPVQKTYTAPVQKSTNSVQKTYSAPVQKQSTQTRSASSDKSNSNNKKDK